MVMSNLLTAVYGSNTESFDNVRNGLQQCSITKDLELFIETHGTGSGLPARTQYKNHYGSGDKKDTPNLHNANTASPLDSPTTQQQQHKANTTSGYGAIQGFDSPHTPTAVTSSEGKGGGGFNDFFRAKPAVPKSEELWVSPNALLESSSTASPSVVSSAKAPVSAVEDEFSDFTSAPEATSNNNNNQGAELTLDDLLFENFK